MSPQLTLSAAFCALAMALFAVSTGHAMPQGLEPGAALAQGIVASVAS